MYKVHFSATKLFQELFLEVPIEPYYVGVKFQNLQTFHHRAEKTIDLFLLLSEWNCLHDISNQFFKVTFLCRIRGYFLHFLAGNASQCKKQCKILQFGNLCLMSALTPLLFSHHSCCTICTYSNTFLPR